MSFSVKSVNTTLNELRQLKHVFKSKGGLAESASSSNTRLIDSVSSSNSQLPRRDPAKLWERAIEIIRRRVRIILAFPIQTHLTQDDKMDFENAVGTENHFESGSSRLFAAKIGFDINDYKSKSKTVGYALSDRLQQILSTKSPSDYTDADIRLLVSLTSSIPAFSKYDIDVRRALCKVLNYGNVSADRYIVKQGRAALNFYISKDEEVIIFRGDETVTCNPPYSPIKKVLSGEVNVYRQDNDQTIKLDTLKSGDSFGDRALLQNITRAASVVSSQETEFLFINKDDFADVLQKEIQTDLERKIQFLNTLPFFKGMQKENVHQLASTGRIREYHQNEVILTEGEFSPHIIVIWEGSCRALKTVNCLRAPTNILPLYRKIGQPKMKSLPPITEMFKLEEPTPRASSVGGPTPRRSLTSIVHQTIVHQRKSTKFRIAGSSSHLLGTYDEEEEEMGGEKATTKQSSLSEESLMLQPQLQPGKAAMSRKSSVYYNKKLDTSTKYKEIFFPIDRTHEEYDLAGLEKNPAVHLKTYLIRLFDTGKGEIFGEESAIANHAPKSVYRETFPTLPYAGDNESTSIISSEGMNSKSTDYHQFLKLDPWLARPDRIASQTESLNLAIQRIQRAQFSIVANDSRVRCFLINANDFARSCSLEMAKQIGLKVKKEGGPRCLRLSSKTQVTADDQESLYSTVRLEKKFMNEKNWLSYKKMTVGNYFKSS